MAVRQVQEARVVEKLVNQPINLLTHLFISHLPFKIFTCKVI